MINAKEARAAVAAEQAARKELKAHTIGLVKMMKQMGRSKDWGDGYMEGVTSGLEHGVSVAAKEYFETAWAAETTAE